jgi:hypothetical protein
MNFPKTPWENDPLRFLLNQRFPALEIFADEGLRKSRPDIAEEYEAARNDSHAYFLELMKLPDEEVGALIQGEKDRFISNYIRGTLTLDAHRFFSDPYSEADIDHWSKISYWTVDEAVALSLNKDPRVVTWERIEEYKVRSGFVFQFLERRELIGRAIEAEQLLDRNTPAFFLAWAARTRFYMPDSLIDAVLSLGNQIADWKSEYDQLATYIEAQNESRERSEAQLQKEHDDALAALKWLDEEYQNLALGQELLQAENASLRKMLEDGQDSKALSGKPLEQRERSGMLKLIIGMAVAYYAYEPKAIRNESIKTIQNDLEAKGFKISDDTIRRYLNEAKQLFPNGGQDA